MSKLERLFKTLKALGYTEWLGISGNSVAHEISEFYKKNGKLNSCEWVYKDHRVALAEFYEDESEKNFRIFDWKNLTMACSGVMIDCEPSGSGW